MVSLIRPGPVADGDGPVVVEFIDNEENFEYVMNAVDEFVLPDLAVVMPTGPGADGAGPVVVKKTELR